MKPNYVPRRGEYISLSFDPQSGHEQMGRRPGLVISHDEFNLRTGFVIACPITRTRRDFPLHVPLPESGAVSGFVMVEQTKSIDFRARGARKIGPAPAAVLNEVLALLDACIY